MKTYFLIVLFFTSHTVFSQGNFNLEWESPANLDFVTVGNMETGNNIPELVFRNLAGSSISFYDGATKVLKYNISVTDSAYPLIFGNTLPEAVADFNGDGIIDPILYKAFTGPCYVKIVSAVNGSILFQKNYAESHYPNIYLYDIDGDNYYELLIKIYNFNDSKLEIYSTPAHTTGIANQNQSIPTDFNLNQNYPNPFNPNTIIEYSINKNSEVKIILYDILGKEIKTLVNENQSAGAHKVILQGSDLPSGAYFYALTVDGVTDSKKMLLNK